MLGLVKGMLGKAQLPLKGAVEALGKGLPGLNERGNMLLFIGIAFLILALLPPVIMRLFPAADIIIRIILVLVIFTTVRGYLGGGILSLIVSGVLIYFLVIKWAYFTASMYVFFYFVMTFAVTSVVIWGIGMNLRRM